MLSPRACRPTRSTRPTTRRSQPAAARARFVGRYQYPERHCWPDCACRRHQLLAITGTPTATGTEVFTVTATDTLGGHDIGELQCHRQRPFRSVPRACRPTRSTSPTTRRSRPAAAGPRTLAVTNIQNAIAGFGCARQRRQRWRSRARPRPRGPRPSRSRPPTRWGPRPRPTTASRSIGRHAGPREPAGRHGQRALQRDAHRRWRHGPRYLGRHQYPEPHRRSGCAASGSNA